MTKKICVIPAAGIGSRWQPFSEYIPKEMLPINNKPVLDLVIDEAIMSGFTKIIIVLNKNKKVIERYLADKSKQNKKLEIKIIYQKKPLGLAHALFLTKDFIDQTSFGVILPDMPIISKKPVLKILNDSAKNMKDFLAVVALAKFPQNNMLPYGQAYTKQAIGIKSIIHFCPRQPEFKTHHSEQRLHIGGRYILHKKIFEFIDQAFTENAKWEKIDDTFIFNLGLTQNKKVFGLEIKEKVYDTGTPMNYLITNSHVQGLIKKINLDGAKSRIKNSAK